VKPQTETYRRTYDAKQSLRYQNRKSAKHAAELRLIDRAFARIPKTHRVLDVPCGGGRVMLHLAKRGYTVAGADVSEGMIEIARESMTRAGLPCPVEYQDVERLTYPDKSFDTIICFRLFHHFPTADIRRRAIAELCRVAAHNVVLSYFSTASMTSAKQKLVAAVGGRKHPRYPVPLSEVKGYFEAAGFRFVKDFAQMPLVHTLHVAVFERAR
jgi:2-polyprenyl-3-methyl-5-hydroxy-6-metoxy-1,4-benzoquinol methylase